MKKRRDRISIIMAILETVEGEGGRSKPTHILYKANLSHKLLKMYLNELKQKEFIAEHEDKSITLSQKGIQFLSELRKMEKFMEMFNL